MVVEKSCGKTCGECGKVHVFNRYFASFPQVYPFSSCIFPNFFVPHNAAGIMLRKQKTQRAFTVFFPKKLDKLPNMSILRPPFPAPLP